MSRAIEKLIARTNDRSYTSTKRFVQIAQAVRNIRQDKTDYEYVCDNSGQGLPNDFFNAYFDVKVRCERFDAGGAYAVADNVRLINGSHSLIENLEVNINGAIIQIPNADIVSHVLNLMDVTKPNAKSIRDLQYFSIDTTDSLVTRSSPNTYGIQETGAAGPVATTIALPLENGNLGAYERKKILGGYTDFINLRIPLNRYGFFNSLENNYLSPARVSIRATINRDDVLIDRTGGNPGRVVIEEMILRVPQIIPNAEGMAVFENSLVSNDKRSWTFLREQYNQDRATRQTNGVFRIPALRRPKHLFVWTRMTNTLVSQEHNPLIFNTFDISANHNVITNIQVEANSGQLYPTEPYRPNVEKVRLYTNLMEYNSDISNPTSSSLIDFSEFQSKYGLIYFDLSKIGNVHTPDTTEITIRYSLDAAPNDEYTMSALVLYESEITLRNVNRSAFLEVR